MFNAERSRSFGMDSIEKPKSRIERALERAERSLQEDAIKMEDFADQYKDYEDDVAEVKRLKSMFAQDPPETKRLRDLAKIFEAVIHDSIELSDWFGPNASTIRPTEYDDYIHGVDEIVEFRESRTASYLALAIDTTSSSDTEGKFRRIKKEIDAGVLAEIKYFRSKHMNIRGGTLENVPRVVVEANRKTIERVMDKWLDGRNTELATDPIQIQILEEIYFQLETFKVYAESHAQGRLEIAGQFARTQEIIADILATKETLIRDLKNNAIDLTDGSTFNLRQSLKTVFHELEWPN